MVVQGFLRDGACLLGKPRKPTELLKLGFAHLSEPNAPRSPEPKRPQTFRGVSVRSLKTAARLQRVQFRGDADPGGRDGPGQGSVGVSGGTWSLQVFRGGRERSPFYFSENVYGVGVPARVLLEACSNYLQLWSRSRREEKTNREREYTTLLTLFRSGCD